MLSVNPNTHRVSCNSSLPLISAQNLRYHNFSIITTLIAELLHSLLSLCIFLRGHNPARWWRWRRKKTLQNSSPTATIDQENKTHQKKQNKTKQDKKTKKQRFGQCPEIARTDRQTDTHVELIYKIGPKSKHCEITSIHTYSFDGFSKAEKVFGERCFHLGYLNMTNKTKQKNYLP